jgi:hypothetical protein
MSRATSILRNLLKQAAACEIIDGREQDACMDALRILEIDRAKPLSDAQTGAATFANTLKQSAERVKAMTPEQREAMEAAQRKCWARQDMA